MPAPKSPLSTIGTVKDVVPKLADPFTQVTRQVYEERGA